MVTTSTPNRIAPYLSEPVKTLPPLPTTADGRQAVLADAVAAALLTLQGELADPDPRRRHQAAVEILDFEKTRLRHGRDVTGTAVASPALDPDPPGWARGDEEPDDTTAGPTADALEAAEAAGAEPEADDELADVDVPPIVPVNDRAAYRDYVQDVREVLTVAYNQSGLKRVVSLGEASEVAHLAVCMRFQGQCEERKKGTVGAAKDE